MWRSTVLNHQRVFASAPSQCFTRSITSSLVRSTVPLTRTAPRFAFTTTVTTASPRFSVVPSTVSSSSLYSTAAATAAATVPTLQLHSNFASATTLASSTSPYTQRETYAQTLRPVEESYSLLPDAYHDPAFYELEKDRIWNKLWVCAGYTTDIPNPGDTKVVQIAGDSIILSRGKKGELNAFYNVCRHRGSTIVHEDGNYKTFTCPYHCWSYALDGKLLGTSMFNKGRRDTKIERHDPTLALIPVQVDNWGPFIFVNKNPKNTVSLKQYLGDLPEKYDRYITAPNGKPIDWRLKPTKKIPSQV
eukprot:TRINITY_DN5014_c0_g1_i1.p1 TRINITY_DN5014_c0_g1~~TRINITY_DN5014_c0_g1_i1.p1  ORF type:complete len:304 (-),score=36.89 TRINITY_DN5014_c0_g1_i1:448-1359(-)